MDTGWQRLDEIAHLEGRLITYERPRGSRLWRRVQEDRNIVVNQFYVDLFNQMLSGSAGNLTPNALALGIGNTPTPARPDTGLISEWQGTRVGVLLSQLNSGTPYTSIPLAYPLSVALPAAAAITVGALAATVTGAGAAINATSIPVNSVTPGANVLALSPVAYAAVATVPQRLTMPTNSLSAADPPAATFSFYLAAGANSVPVQFQEAGVLYNASSLVAAGSPTRFMNHLLWSYQKAPNTDLRLDYVLGRSLT